MTQIIKLSQLDKSYLAGRDIIVVIGFFDGLHKGHQKIIGLCVNRAKKIGGSSLVFTFDRPPLNVIKGTIHKKLITSFEQKLSLIEKLGVDYIVTQSFSREFSMLGPKDFCKKILMKKFHLKEIFVGEGFRFGYGGKGDGIFLKQFLGKYGIKVNIIPLYRENGIIISSTNIRKYYRKGAIDKVSKLLGRKPCISGAVVKGVGRGKKLGFPTANIDVSDKYVTPQDGVYLGQVKVGNEDKLLPCLVNIGDNPTFEDNKKWIEVFIIDFNKNIYGVKIKVCFLKELRKEIRFNSSQELVDQMQKDLKAGRDFFNLS
ncbi:MAG: bifunctional riboflavin kinase/FAD synthetase [Actinomycetota bacterium]